jgi:hypothetical protein
LPFTTTYPQIVLIALTIALALAVLFGAVTSGIAFGSYNPSWEGTSELREEADIDSEVIVATDTERYESIEANGTVAFIIAPDQQYDPEEIDRVQSFVDNGGIVIIADDLPGNSNQLLADIGSTIRLDGDPVRDDRNYQESPALLRATETADHPLTNDIDELALNHGTVLNPGEASVLVRTSEYAYIDRNRNEELDDDETLASYPVVAVEEQGDGEILVISDPSVLINVMIDRSDNRAFVQALVDEDRVLLDTTHGDEIPPLMGVLLAVQNSAPLQLLIGFAGIGLVAVWSRGGLRVVSRRLWSPFVRMQTDESPNVALGPADIGSVVATEHPDWDESYRNQITTAIISQQDDNHPNDGSSGGTRRNPKRDGEGPDR